MWRVPNKDRERDHRQRDEQCGIRWQIELRHRARAKQRVDRCSHRFELKCNVGRGANDADERRDRSHRLALAVPCRQKVSDRRNVLALCQLHDFEDQRRAQREAENGAGVDRQEVEAAGYRKADAAEESP